MTAPRDALSLSVNFNDGTGVVALQMTYSWVGPTFGESLPAPIATLTAASGASLFSVHYATSEAAPSDAYGGQFYLREGTGDPAAPTWGPWILWVEEPASAWSGGFSSTLTVPAALTPPDTLLAVDPPVRDQYGSTCLDCVDSGPILLSRSGGTPSWARYLVAYTWVDAAGRETRAQTVALDTASLHGGTAASTSTWQPREKHFSIIPAGTAAARWYVKPPLDTSDPASALAGWLHAADVPVVAGTLADWTLSVADAGTWPAAALPALNATCRAGWLRLSHASGQSYIQQNGMQVQVRAGDADVLDLPLPVLPGTPATLVGQDTATGLPAFCPAPNPIVATAVLQQGTEQPAPPSTTCTQVRCGAATALRDHLNDWYQNVRTILNAALNTLGMALGSLLVDTGTAFFVALTDGIDIELAPEVYNLLKLVLKAVPGVTGAALQAGFALLSTSQLEWLRTKVYCHIACSANQITLTQDQMFAWHDDIAADTTILSGIQRDVCAAIVAWGANWALSAWAQQAQTGAGLPTHDCDAYVCP